MKYHWLSLFLVLSVLVLAHPVLAQVGGEPKAIDFTPEVPIPGVFDKTVPVDNKLLSNYIRGVYVYFVWIVGVLAAFMVTYGGIKWVTAAGNPSRINDARNVINQAIIGVIIALTAVVMLNLIDPQYTRVGLPDLPAAQKKYFIGAATTDFCSPSYNIKCGDVKKLGSTVIDPNGETVPEFCIGTICSDDASLCQVVQSTLPGYRKDASSFTSDFILYAPGNGCVKGLKIKQPAPGPYQSLTSLDVAFDDGILRPTLTCGNAYDDIKKAGNVCKNAGNANSCVLATSAGQPVEVEIIDQTSKSDIIRNMSCPTDLIFGL